MVGQKASNMPCLLSRFHLIDYTFSFCHSGDKWAYSFDVVHAIPELIKRRGGKVGFVKNLEAHFLGGHNEHSNEVNCQN